MVQVTSIDVIKIDASSILRAFRSIDDEMARAKSQNNGNGRVDRLEEALSSFMANHNALMQQISQNQAAFNAQMAATNARFAELEARHVEYERRTQETFAKIEQRFQSIDKTLGELTAAVNEHTLILQALPEAIREKMGFRPNV